MANGDENIERTAKGHDATSHPSWGPGDMVGGFLDKYHFGTGQQVRVPKSGAPQDAPEDVGDIVVDGVTVKAIPVQQVANETYEAFQIYVNPFTGGFGSPLAILSFDDERKRALITNSDAAVKVIVGKLAQVQTGIGYLLAPGQTIEIKSRQAVYAAAATGSTSVAVSVWTERGR